MAQDTYTTEKFHPITGEKTECRVFLNFFGVGKDGYRFKDEQIFYSYEEINALLPSNDG